MGFFSRWLKKSPVSVAQKFSESPVNISQVAQLPIDWFGAGVYDPVCRSRFTLASLTVTAWRIPQARWRN